MPPTLKWSWACFGRSIGSCAPTSLSESPAFLYDAREANTMSATAPAVAPVPNRPYRFLIETLLFLSYFVFGMSWIGYSPFLKEIQQQFALDYTRTGLVISAVSFAKIFVPLV